MRRLFILALLFCLPIMAVNAVYGQDGKAFDKRLLGKWRSDKEKTLEWLNENRCISGEIETKFRERIYGHLTLEFTENKVITTWQGDDSLRHETPFNIVWAEGNIVIRCFEVPGEEYKMVQIIMIENKNSMYILPARSDRIEYFKRVE